MCIAALFIVAKSWKQPRCSSVSEWVTKQGNIHTMEFYSVLKGNELSGPEKTRRNLKCILASEKSQSEKGYIFYGSHYITIWKRQNYRDTNDPLLSGVGTRSEGMGRGREMTMRSTEMFK